MTGLAVNAFPFSGITAMSASSSSSAASFRASGPMQQFQVTRRTGDSRAG